MTQQTINIGTAANDGTGDPLRDAFDKVNDNFTELYAGAGITVDNDTTLASDSTTNPPSVHAVRQYVALAVTGLLDLKGATDCSANPNYPAASKGDFYIVSVAGKIGGASGTSVDAGDAYFATADNAGGTEASVGSSWAKLEHNGVYGAGATTASTTEALTGTDPTKVVTPDALAALWEQGSDVASAGTISLGEGGYFNITGTTTITDIDFATDKAGRHAWVKFAGALTLTHNSSTLILPTGANITTAAGDTACFISEGADVVRCVSYQRASGAALAGGGGGSGNAWNLQWSPFHNEAPSSNYATLDTRNGHPCLDFDTTTQETAIFSGALPADYSGAGVTVHLWCSLTSATSGTVGWDVAFERMDASSLDIDADSFGSATTVTATTVPGTSGQFLKMSVNVSNGANMDSLAAGEMFRLRLRRDVANDTATGDAELLRVMLVSQ
jgi:hypothetical protein